MLETLSGAHLGDGDRWILCAGISLQIQKADILKPAGLKLTEETTRLLCAGNSGEPIALDLRLRRKRLKEYEFSRIDRSGFFHDPG
jgi:hypothetical protein